MQNDILTIEWGENYKRKQTDVRESREDLTKNNR